MTVQQLCEQCGFSVLFAAEDAPEVTSAYACDLLSWVIGRAQGGAALVTVMTNVNVIAVAVMAELSCVVLCEGVVPDEIALQKAKQQGISIVSSPYPTYETCLAIGKAL